MIPEMTLDGDEVSRFDPSREAATAAELDPALAARGRPAARATVTPTPTARARRTPGAPLEIVTFSPMVFSSLPEP
jgi:hypothetical protein